MADLAELLRAAGAPDGDAGPPADANRERILDAALQEAAAVGLQRMTVEDVVRRAGLGRMTVHRRFPKRADLVDALVRRETQRFLAAVAAAIERAPDPREGVAEAFVAAVTFAREHPMLRRLAHAEPGAVTETVAAGDAAVLRTGTAFIAAQIAGEGRRPSPEVRWVADVLARLFLTWIAIPPADPDPADDAQLRRFATQVLTPMIERAAGATG